MSNWLAYTKDHYAIVILKYLRVCKPLHITEDVCWFSFPVVNLRSVISNEYFLSSTRITSNLKKKKKEGMQQLNRLTVARLTTDCLCCVMVYVSYPVCMYVCGSVSQITEHKSFYRMPVYHKATARKSTLKFDFKQKH